MYSCLHTGCSFQLTSDQIAAHEALYHPERCNPGCHGCIYRSDEWAPFRPCQFSTSSYQVFVDMMQALTTFQANFQNQYNIQKPSKNIQAGATTRSRSLSLPLQLSDSNSTQLKISIPNDSPTKQSPQPNPSPINEIRFVSRTRSSDLGGKVPQSARSRKSSISINLSALPLSTNADLAEKGGESSEPELLVKKFPRDQFDEYLDKIEQYRDVFDRYLDKLEAQTHGNSHQSVVFHFETSTEKEIKHTTIKLNSKPRRKKIFP